MEYMGQVEQRREALADAKWSAALFASTSEWRNPPNTVENTLALRDMYNNTHLICGLSQQDILLLH